ncbi:glycosyltransferase family 2 protein [Flavobacterium laiguense]|uniref:Glycosyltransferase family 2 protein n=1 Tax=Flavobacterium laiguense TaxID=2169409 RepID=A0A2U1JXL4_9FLAO|nr:glycosyltransferase family A protein [Flavobacterium laiguense]PWA09950.1 glycosyltransferase family 2 protein [Flavobacterium laiguense]
MIVIYHNSSCITRVESEEDKTIVFDRKKTIAFGLMQVAIQFPESTLVWCHQECQEQIDIAVVPEILHHQKMMLSYNPTDCNYLGSKIGYVEESPFINVNKKVTYPTWQMSSLVGVIHATVLIAFKDKIKLDSDFDYYLNSIAKIGMSLGLLCYSEPKLLVKAQIKVTSSASVFTLFKFVKQHYKTRWIFLLLLNILLYERRFLFFAFIFALFFKNRNRCSISLASIPVQSNRHIVERATIDVIIPTIGRKQYLYDVLKDLAKQTHLPINVIIVEQNPQEGSVSELDYLHTEKWPFEIKHTFTHQAGACNARNLALNQVESEWVFLNDDDNRFESDLIEKVFENIKKYGVKSVTTSYLQPNELLQNSIISQSGIFGSGNSFLKTELLKQVSFNESLEFGYGEDTDFGLQLRNLGIDIIYFPNLNILHLKAPMGGFRIKPTFVWSNEKIQPKPSPTIMYVKQKYNVREQVMGYKTTLFFKFFKFQTIKNPFRYLIYYKKQWKKSVYWVNILKNKS